LSTLDGEIMVINPVDYIDMDTPLLFKCSECGAEFSATPRNYLKRNFTRCKNCRHYSKGEESIAKYLEEHNIVFIRQMKFDECSDKRPLPFDFYLPYYNMLIEYNGEQHYRPIEYWGGNEKFEYIKYHDDIKLDYAINNNINLLVIKYTEDGNIEQILKNKLNLE
jgi:DNA-directed RNA polymerase subunit RPC12/RpoP